MVILTPEEQARINAGSAAAATRYNTAPAPKPTTLAEDQAKAARQGQPGFDQLGDPIPGYTSPTGGTTRYTSPTGVTSDLGNMFAPGGAFGTRAAMTPAEEAAVRERERAAVQARIDAINESATRELTKARMAADARSGRNRARLSATGQLGSGSETTSYGELDDRAAEERAAIESMRIAKLEEIFSGVENRAKDIIAKHGELARSNSEKYMGYLKGVSEQAVNDMTALATAQADLSPSQRQRLIEQSGYDEATFDTLYKSLKIANAPQDVYINKDKPEIVGNKAVYFKQVKDPVTGQTKLVSETLDLPGTAGKKVKSTVNTAEGVQVLFEDGTYQRIGGLPPKAGSGSASSGPSQYQRDRAERIIGDINKLIGDETKGIAGEISDFATGFSGAFSFPLMGKQVDIPGSPAYQLNQKLETIKSNIAFGELQAMREASKTGGALGGVAIRELELLEKTLGSLDIGIGEQQLKDNLEDIRASLERWRDANGSAPAASDDGGSGGAFTVETSEGTFTFPTQEAADAFKAEAGL